MVIHALTDLAGTLKFTISPLKVINMEEVKESSEPKVRLNFKRNFKGEIGWEITTRGDTVVEALALLKEAKIELEKIK